MKHLPDLLEAVLNHGQGGTPKIARSAAAVLCRSVFRIALVEREFHDAQESLVVLQITVKARGNCTTFPVRGRPIQQAADAC